MKHRRFVSIGAGLLAVGLISAGQTVMTSLLQAHPSINAVYSENDAMTCGAVTAIRNGGKTPGQDVKIVTIDGTSEGVQDIVSGKVFADIETNPRFGPLVFSQIAIVY